MNILFEINKLIIIGGPSCVGKTTLIKKIQLEERAQLCKQLGITEPSSWNYTDANDLEKINYPIEKLILHYDFFTQYTEENTFKYLQKLIINSKNITVLTLYTTPHILIHRNKSRSKFLKIFKALLHPKIYKKNRIVSLLHDFRKEQKKRYSYKHGIPIALYEKWFYFFSQNSVDSHWIMDSGKISIKVAQPYTMNTVEYFDCYTKAKNFTRSASLDIEQIFHSVHKTTSNLL